ncbi:MAG TPA: hypothetical protein G4O08_07715 [Anaerolineae bacterium]|nr:hypothetical protein [Anaerolineae bacterium]
MKNHARIHLFPILLMILLLAGCGSTPSMDTANDAGFVAVCDLSEDILGWKATTRGEITFFDLSPPDGVFLEIIDDGCQIGVFFHNDFWNTFSNEQQAYVAYGNHIEVSGIVAKSGGDLHITCQTIDLVE